MLNHIQFQNYYLNILVISENLTFFSNFLKRFNFAKLNKKLK